MVKVLFTTIIAIAKFRSSHITLVAKVDLKGINVVGWTVFRDTALVADVVLRLGYHIQVFYLLLETYVLCRSCVQRHDYTGQGVLSDIIIAPRLCFET